MGQTIWFGGTDDLVFKILVYISHFAGQRTDLLLLCIHSVDQDFPVHISDDKMRDQAVQRLTKRGFPAAVVSNDRQEIPFFNDR